MNVSAIRELVKHELREMSLDDAPSMGERVLLRDRYMVGRRFQFTGVSATWLAEDEEVTFHDESGETLKTVSVREEPQELRRAA